MKKFMCIIIVLIVVVSAPAAAFAATGIVNHSEMAREVLALVNEERSAAGLKPVAWMPSLVSFATTRSREIMDPRHWSHTRPNGQQATDHPDVNGENLAYGTIFSAQEVVDGWMNSPSHRENILRPVFTHMAVSCLEATVTVQGREVVYYYWTQLFHINPNASNTTTQNQQQAQQNQSQSQNQTSTATQPAAGTYSRSANVGADGFVTQNLIYDEARSAVAARTSVRPILNASFIYSATVSRLAEFSNLTVMADTTTADNKTVQGRMYLRPSELKLTGDRLALGVWTESGKTARMAEAFGKWYINKLAVVQLDQQGALGARIQIAAKVDLIGLNTNNLIFYSYDQTANKVTRIANPNYSIDQSGIYLHFYTNLGGSIIITDRELATR